MSEDQYTFIDPLFADTSNQDFNLNPYSLAINGGINHPNLPLYDYAGKLRDTTAPDVGALVAIPCLENVLLNYSLGSASYQVSDKIFSAGQVVATAEVFFKAGFEIELLEGFEVEIGAIFSAEIDGCD